MKKPFIAMILLLVSTGAAAQLTSTTPVISVPAPVPALPSASAQKLILWQSGTTLCNGVPQQPIRLPMPAIAMGWIAAGAEGPKPVTIDFAIDSTGRPHAIKRRNAAYSSYSDDLEPTLATAQFTPGAPKEACQLIYQAKPNAIDDTPADMLIEYSLFPLSGRLPKAGFERIHPTGSDCVDPMPAPRNRVYPKFDAIPQAPGTRSWSMISFNIDAGGRPTRVKPYRSTGNAALDRAATKAVAASRFEPKARQGCLYPYWRIGKPLAAPMVPEGLIPTQNATCTISESWKIKPVPAYPEAHRRRGVEGWTVIGYDVAPWGATGNLRVIASEPSATFGLAALQSVRSASKEASASGHLGCVTRVRFEMSDSNKSIREPTEPSPPF